MDFIEQAKAAKKAKHERRFHDVLSLGGGLPVTTEDCDFALDCTEQELRVIALAAHARYRWTEPGLAEETGK